MIRDSRDYLSLDSGNNISNVYIFMAMNPRSRA